MYPASNRSNSGTPNSTHAIFSSVIAVFLSLMALKYVPTNTVSPFEIHGVMMTMFVISILVYPLTLCPTPYFPEIIHNINLLSGSFAPVSLASILFPRLGFFTLFIWLIYSVKLMYDTFRELYQLYMLYKAISHDSLNLLAFIISHHADTSRNSARTTRTNKHVILGFPVAVLLALMPLKFRSINTNTGASFDAHSGVMSIFVACMLIYATAWVTEATFQTGDNSYRDAIIRKISVLSGSLVTVLLVLVIVPRLGLFILLAWILFFVKLIYDGCRELHLQCLRISTVSQWFNRIGEVFGRIGQAFGCVGRPEHIALPV